MKDSKFKRLSDLSSDQRNANRHTARGMSQLEHSLRNLGAARSIAVDKNGVIIAGNATAETAMSIGMEDIILVPSDGNKLVVVMRTDIDIYKDKKAREIAIADNRVSDTNLNFDYDQIIQEWNSGIEIHHYWTEEEIAAMMNLGQEEEVENDKDPEPTTFKVNVKCKSREEMEDLIHRLSGEGFNCNGVAK